MNKMGINSMVERMYTESARLKTFKNWPFDENAKCSAAKVSFSQSESCTIY